MMKQLSLGQQRALKNNIQCFQVKLRRQIEDCALFIVEVFYSPSLIHLTIDKVVV